MQCSYIDGGCGRWCAGSKAYRAVTVPFGHFSSSRFAEIKLLKGTELYMYQDLSGLHSGSVKRVIIMQDDLIGNIASSF
jgi:hypothetical protein